MYNVAVIAGGDSAERAVSLDSGRSIVRALASRGHRVTVIDPADIELTHVDWSQHDVAWLALHGTFGEDGQVQSQLDELGVVYTGSDAAASRLAFSKSAAKECFRQHGMATPSSMLLHREDYARAAVAARPLGYPLVVKPDAQGSSLGVTIVHYEDDLSQAIDECFRLGKFALLERFVDGQEWTVALIDERVLPAIRIESARTFFDYEAKYHDDATGYEFAECESDELIHTIESVAARAARSVGTRGIARVDVMLDDADRPWVLEVNTIPGMTDHSLVPKAAQRAGIDFAELCELAMVSSLTERRRSLAA